MTMVAGLSTGFADGVVSAHSTFRSVMDAMARPGSVQKIVAAVGTPWPLMPGTAAIALTLFDHDTPIWLDRRMSETPEVANWLKFHSGAPVVTDPSVCGFAVVVDGATLPDLERFSFGTAEYPDRSTTLILQVESLTQGCAYELRGPGINGAVVLRAKTEPKDLFERLAVNATLFPRGIDVVLVSDDEIVAIPRTTRLAVHGV
ncbi:MAG TPA: phosphonate C-P lyase system protein PhnH [Bradyrhizobium sp.]|nr:phosphonate C-P lyase system protein PhnH [Bradyrhizobium sp.]